MVADRKPCNAQKNSVQLDRRPLGLRQIVGHSRKRGFHWHYGVTCWTRSAPVRHVRVAGRVVFTSDGQDPIGDAKRLHRMRRSFCKSWRNDKWRDLLQAFWFWIANGTTEIAVPMGEGVALKLTLPPVAIEADFGIDAPDDELADPDDDDEEAAQGSVDEEGSDNDPEDWDDEE